MDGHKKQQKRFCYGLLVFCVSYIYMIWDTKTFKQDSLFGKNVLVTGGSRGIGKAIALQYAKYGANVFITARGEKQLKKVMSFCKNVGSPKAIFGYVSADMANYTMETERVVKEAVHKFGGLDHIILNHALLTHPEARMGWNGSHELLENIEAQFDIGMLSYVHLTAHALPYLRQSSAGRIGVIGSIAGKSAVRVFPSYSAVKFSLDGFFSSLRELFEHDGSNVAVTYHILGPVATEALANLVPPKALFDLEWFCFLMPTTTPEEAADEVIKATTRGDAELYFPHLFGWVRGGCRIFPIIRHIWHNLISLS